MERNYNSLEPQLAYISAPFEFGNEEALKEILEYSKYIYSRGFIPIVPYLALPAKDDENDYLIEPCLNLLQKCDVLLILGNEITPRMQKEIDCFHRVQTIFVGERN